VQREDAERGEAAQTVEGMVACTHISVLPACARGTSASNRRLSTASGGRSTAAGHDVILSDVM
jgi:hypothetical protein